MKKISEIFEAIALGLITALALFPVAIIAAGGWLH